MSLFTHFNYYTRSTHKILPISMSDLYQGKLSRQCSSLSPLPSPSGKEPGFSNKWKPSWVYIFFVTTYETKKKRVELCVLLAEIKWIGWRRKLVVVVWELQRNASSKKGATRCYQEKKKIYLVVLRRQCYTLQWKWPYCSFSGFERSVLVRV